MTAFVTPTEELLRDIWSDVLCVDIRDRYQDFFLHGGDSLLATIVSVKIRQQIGVELQPSEIFLRTKLYELAAHLDDRKE